MGRVSFIFSHKNKWRWAGGLLLFPLYRHRLQGKVAKCHAQCYNGCQEPHPDCTLVFWLSAGFFLTPQSLHKASKLKHWLGMKRTQAVGSFQSANHRVALDKMRKSIKQKKCF